MTRTNLEILQAVFAASAEKDWDTVKSLVHDDIEIFEPDSLPYAGVHKGPDGFVALIQKVFSTWEDTTHTVNNIVCDGDFVIQLAHMTGRGKASGQPFSVPMAEVWRFRDGKVAQIRPFYFDTKAMCDAHIGSDN